jgi:transposase
MQTITTIGLDIAKSVFQVHGVDADGNVVVRRQLKRRYVLAFFQKLPSCLVGIEACASSHYWSRELQALGHTVRLMPPAYVKPYVKRQKNDAADAEAICEAVTRPNMRFVPTKTPEQQSCLSLHRTRHLFVRQQTAIINAIRAHLAEFGIVAPVGRRGVEQLLKVVSLSTQLIHRRRSRRDPLCKAPWYAASAMAHGIAGAAADQGRCHRPRQQDRAHGLGDDGQGRALQGTHRTSGLKREAGKRSHRNIGVM